MGKNEVAEAIDGSDGLVRAAGRMPSARSGAAALALALGRVAGRWDLPLEELLELARVSRDEGALAQATHDAIFAGYDPRELN